MAESSRYGSVERAAAPSASRPRRVGLAVLGAASVFLLAAATRRAGAAPLASMLPVQPAEEDDGAVGLLRFEAYDRDYGAMSMRTRKLYDMEHIVEPFHETTFKVVDAIAGRLYEWRLHVRGRHGTDVEDDGVTEEHAHQAKSLATSFNYTFEVVNNVYRLSLIERSAHTGDELREYASDDVTVKYVRREVRKLTDVDRDRFLDALQVMYSTPLIEGRKKFGSEFMTAGYFAALHNTDEFCYHGGDMFVTTHGAFQLWLERSLRTIDPTLPSSPYWDFTIDTALFGGNWSRESPIYQHDWWGKTSLGPGDDWRVTEGRWAYTRMPTHGETSPFLIGQENSYGLQHAECDNSASPYIQRSTSFCGLESVETLASRNDIVHCFMNHSTLSAWDYCVENNIHGNLHQLHGGAWSCSHDFAKLSEEDPLHFPERVLQWLGPLLFNAWFNWGFSADLFTCVLHDSGEGGFPCDRADAACGSVSSVNVANMTDREVWRHGNSLMATLRDGYRGHAFIEEIKDVEDSTHYTVLQYGARMKWSHLPPSEQTYFTRWVLDLVAKPGLTGVAASGASPADPLFWLWHPIYDRMRHALQTMPAFLESGYHEYDLRWDSTSFTCMGGHWLDHTPFKDVFEGDVVKGRHFDNRALWGLLDPLGGHIPYVYDNLDEWGLATWYADGDGVKSHGL